MSATNKIAECKLGDQEYVSYCHQRLEDAHTFRHAIFWHERLITELSLEILVVHVSPCKDFEPTVDELLETQDGYVMALSRLKSATIETPLSRQSPTKGGLNWSN